VSSAPEHLRVLVAVEVYGALDRLIGMLGELGHDAVGKAVAVGEVAREIRENDPHVALVKLHADDEHALDLIDELVQEADCAVIALLEVERPEFIGRAAERGIFGYVQPVTPEAIQSALEVAVRRHADLRRLNDEVEQLESALARRAVIERAKGILMERHSLDERAAFNLLREHARSSNTKIVDLARSVALGQQLLPR
jgi:response regulator NasT